MEKAIKRAIEGGYENVTIGHNGAILDPFFWQALGKAEGWKLGHVIEYYQDRVGGIDRKIDSLGREELYEWEYHMHRFIDHIIAEKPIDEFFNQLLK